MGVLCDTHVQPGCSHVVDHNSSTVSVHIGHEHQQLINVCPFVQTTSWPGVWGSNSFPQQPQNSRSQTPESAREALKFVFSAEGAFFRDFIMDELVRSIDAMSR